MQEGHFILSKYIVNKKGESKMAVKSIVLYYSLTGTTQQLANIIEKIAGSEKIVRIEEEVPYPKDKKEFYQQVREDREQGIDPAYKPVDVDVEAYDVIFIGTPNWGGVVASPLATFLKDVKFEGKKIVPFLTHGGAGEEDIEENIAELCPMATVTPSYISFGKIEQDEIHDLTEWLYTHAPECF